MAGASTSAGGAGRWRRRARDGKFAHVATPPGSDAMNVDGDAPRRSERLRVRVDGRSSERERDGIDGVGAAMELTSAVDDDDEGRAQRRRLAGGARSVNLDDPNWYKAFASESVPAVVAAARHEAPGGVVVRIRGRGVERARAIASTSYGLQRIDAFWEPRLCDLLYNKVPLPSESTFQLTKERIGNWNANVYTMREESESVALAATKEEMFTAIARLADAPQEMNEKLIGWKTRKRALEGCLRTYRCRAYPTNRQAKILRKFAVMESITAYNAAIDVIGDASTAESRDFQCVRKRTMEILAPSSRDFPTSMVEAGIMQAMEALGSNVRKQCIAERENREVIKFTLKKRSRRGLGRLTCTFKYGTSAVKGIERVSSRGVKLDFTFHAMRASAIRALGSVKVRESREGDLNDKFNFQKHNTTRSRTQKEDISFSWDTRRRRWYISIVHDAPAPKRTLTPAECSRAGVYDLGIRTPAVIYSPTDGSITKPYDNYLRDKMRKRWLSIDNLQANIGQRNYARAKARNPAMRRSRAAYARTTRRMKATLTKRYLEMSEWMMWCHRSVAARVANTYDAIVCAKLQYATLFSKDPADNALQRRIKRSSRRVSYALSLSASVNALRYAAVQRGKIVCIDRAIESGTTKTCGRCGWWNAAIGHATVFECAQCALRIDRDWNGARNNALQILADGGFGRDAEYIERRNAEISRAQ